MKKSLICLSTAVLAGSVQAQEMPLKMPNVILIYVDDLGYGDLSCYGANGVKTPNVDRLAREGVRFTDAHCTAATCTPSRYSLLTGSYAFRNDAAILPGDAPLLIDTDQGTLPKMFKESNYTTGIIGKWHLGLGDGNLNWNGMIKPGPLEIGFDYSFIIPATGDRVPCVFVENHRIVGLSPDDPVEVSYEHPVGDGPTGKEHPELLKMRSSPGQGHDNTIVNGVGRIGYMSGGNSARWNDEEFPDILTGKAIDFIMANQDNPFFLYFAFHDIHVPRIINPRFIGKSELGPRGDAIVQMDWCTGELIKTLEELGIAENTLVIFSSDNGPVLDDGYEDQAVEKIGDHIPSGPFRGGKYSAFEAGTRVPMIAWWPGITQPVVSKALMTQVDLFASLSHLTGYKLKDQEAPDSFEHLDALLGHSNQGRSVILEESRTLSLRQNEWKYIKPQVGPSLLKLVNIESGLSVRDQLYNLAMDKGEKNNLAKDYPEKLKELKEMLREIEDKNHSRPGFLE